jgi:hypothetical protein
MGCVQFRNHSTAIVSPGRQTGTRGIDMLTAHNDAAVAEVRALVFTR